MVSELKQLRAEKSISLNRLAKLTQISPATLSNWENERHLPNPDRLARVFDALNTPPAQRHRILYLVSQQSARPATAQSDGYVPVCGDLIAGLRLRRGHSEIQLAEAVGVSDRMVRKWETGESLPSGKSREAAISFLRADPITARAIRSRTIAEISSIHPDCHPDRNEAELLGLLTQIWDTEADLCAFYCLRATYWNRMSKSVLGDTAFSIHLMAGNRMWTMGHLEEAQHWWKRALRHFESEWRDYTTFGSAIVLRRMHDLAKFPKITADRLIEDSAGLHFNRAWPLTVASRAYASAGKSELAMYYADMHSALWQEEHSWKINGIHEKEPAHFRANILARLGRFREVLELTEAPGGRGLDPMFVLSLRAQAALALGDFSLAQRALQEAADILENYPDWPVWVADRSKSYMDRIWLAPLRTALAAKTISGQVGDYRDWPDSPS